MEMLSRGDCCSFPFFSFFWLPLLHVLFGVVTHFVLFCVLSSLSLSLFSRGVVVVVLVVVVVFLR